MSRTQLLGALRKVCGPRTGRISETAMRTNASCVTVLVGRAWSYGDIYAAAVGTRALIDRGTVQSIPVGAEWTLRVLTDASPVVDPMQRGLDAFRVDSGAAP